MATTRSAPHSATRSATAKKPYVLYALVGVVVLAVIVGVSYRPVLRNMKLKALDTATEANAGFVATDYVRFEGEQIANVLAAIQAKRGPFSAQVRMATEVHSFDALMRLAERSDLTPAQRVQALLAGAEVFNAAQQQRVPLPSALVEWAENGSGNNGDKNPGNNEDADLEAAAFAVAVAYGQATPDPLIPAMVARIANKPGQDPKRVAVALDGLSKLLTEDSVSQALLLLQGPACEATIAHTAIPGQIRSLTRAPLLPTMLTLLDHPRPAVRALALETLGGESLAANVNPKMRAELGPRIANKLNPAAPAVEVAAALKATKGLRLTGAREAVLALLPSRAQLGLPGIDDAWLADCLGRALVLSQPDAERPATDAFIVKLTAALTNPVARPVAAKALAQISDGGFVQLRPALDKLAEYGETPECMAALISMVSKTYARADVAKKCGTDLRSWREFLLKERPRSARAAEIRAYVDAHQEMQRVSMGIEKLTETKDYLDVAGKDLQAWCDDRQFVPPLGLSMPTIEALLHDVKLLHFGVNKAMPGTK